MTTPIINTTVEALLKSRPRFRPYIERIRFPFYRNLEPQTRIEFAFPFTVFVGKNGTSKSSTLQALYGCPKGRSVGDYWFATSVDTIVDTQNDLEQSFVYSYRNELGKEVDVLKLRRKRAGNPEYWEPEAPLLKYGMNPADARAEPVSMEVLYLDFRAELSAFDKFFYFPDETRLSLLDRLTKARQEAAQRKATRARRYSKQDYIRRKSKSVRKLLDGLVKFIFSPTDRAKPKNKPPSTLSAADLKAINWILDKKYVAGTVLEHGIYGNQWGKTVLFKTENVIGGEYSEAFAGSGEVAVAILVHAISSSADCSLVLLDEPEVSLHPIAQERLKAYLLEATLKKRAQVVVSTHSPYLVSGLPQTAVKVFRQQPDGLVVVHQEFTADEAFREVASHDDKKTVLVEDHRAKVLLDAAFKRAGRQALEAVSVQVSPGGVSQIYFDIGVYCRSVLRLYVVFDGDQKPPVAIDPAQLPHGASEADLKMKVTELTSGNDENGPPLRWVGAKADERCAHIRSYLEFLKSRVFYLPKKTPEETAWQDDVAKGVLDRYAVTEPGFSASLFGEPDFKKRLIMMSDKIDGAVNPDSLFREFVTHAVRKDFSERGPLHGLVESLRRAT